MPIPSSSSLGILQVDECSDIWRHSKQLREDQSRFAPLLIKYKGFTTLLWDYKIGHCTCYASSLLNGIQMFSDINRKCSLCTQVWAQALNERQIFVCRENTDSWIFSGGVLQIFTTGIVYLWGTAMVLLLVATWACPQKTRLVGRMLVLLPFLLSKACSCTSPHQLTRQGHLFCRSKIDCLDSNWKCFFRSQGKVLRYRGESIWNVVIDDLLNKKGMKNADKVYSCFTVSHYFLQQGSAVPVFCYGLALWFYLKGMVNVLILL